MLKHVHLTATLAVAAGIFVFWFAPARANLIINGDFTTPVPFNSTGGGWTNFNNDGAGGWKPSGGSFDEHFVLNLAGQAATDPTIEQMVMGLVVSTGYVITGDVESFASSFGNPAALSFGVEIGGLLTEFTRNQVSPGNSVGSFSVNFTANATSMLLSLTSERNGDDSSYRIDNISLDRAQGGGGGDQIPEPASLAIFAFGLMGLGRRLKRHGPAPTR